MLAGPEGHPFHPLLVPLPIGAFVSSLGGLPVADISLAPFAIEDGALLAPGPHEFSRSIQELAAGGMWLVSATYFAFE